MTTEIIELTADPVQITNGSECAYIRVENGNAFKIADSDDQPTDLSVFQTIGEITVNPPFVIWAWSEQGSRVSVSKRNAG